MRSRREISLWLVPLLAWAVILVCLAPSSGAYAQTVGPAVSIQQENAKPGTTDWQITYPEDAPGEIEGYANLTSVPRGGQISLFVNTTDPTYTLDVYRMGWYGGAGGRLMMPEVTLNGIVQTIPPPDPATGLVDCAWTNPYVLTIANPNDPSDWPSGVYLVKLTGQVSGYQSYIIFVVRDDGQASDLLFQTSVTTYQAYNLWGGYSLYGDEAVDGGVASKVSFNRPYDNDWVHDGLTGFSVPPGAGHFLRFEYSMLRFLESNSYNVTYATDIDTHSNPNLLLSHKGFLSVGHDEYWTWEMRQNVENARDAGVNLGFFSANDCFWQIRLDPSAVTGDPYRTIVGYKINANNDPVTSDPSTYYLMTTQWGLPHMTLPGMPEEEMIGVGFVVSANGDLTVVNPSNWVFAGTGLSAGSTIPGIVGYEIDSMNQFSPPQTVLLASTPAVVNNKTYNANTTIYQGSSGAMVFGAGTIEWSWGLDDYVPPTPVANPVSKQITQNILARFINPPAPLPFPVAVLSPASLAFGNQIVGRTSPLRWATLTNDQPVPLNISSLGASGDYQVVSSTCASSLPANTNCKVTLQFSPTAYGARNGTLTVVDDASNSTQTVALTGNGVAAAAVTPAAVSFGSWAIGTTSTTLNAKVNNYQTIPLNFSAVGITGPFQIVNNTCGSSIPAASSCNIGVAFSPPALGSFTGTLSISEDAVAPISVPLAGSGVPPVTVQPASLGMGTVLLGSQAGVQSITLRNYQVVPLTISNLAISGPAPSDFAITSNSCGSSVAARSACTIGVVFAPTTTGYRSATLAISDTPDPASPYSIPLSGVGVLPVSVSPSSIWFASQVVGTQAASRSVTVTNNQSVAVSFGTVSIGGNNPGDFVQTGTTCGSTLSAKSSCTMSIAFAPSATGTRTATLAISDSPDPNSPYSIALSGSGVLPVTVTPSSLGFGTQGVGSPSASASVVINNNQSVAISIGSVSFGGNNPGDFIQTATTCAATLAARSSCTIAIAFAPTTTGTRSATLTISDNPDSGSPYTISLGGSGAVPVAVNQ